MPCSADLPAMRRERLTRFLSVLCAVAVVSITLLWDDYSPQTTAAQVPGGSIGTGRGSPSDRPRPPATLRLPSLGVTAPVVRIASDGRELVPPYNYTTVGWWEGGAAPGASQGAAVIVGHTVHTGGGALDNLGDMQPGDVVIIDRPRDELRYRVASVRAYATAKFGKKANRILSQSGPGRLAIITCGDWNGKIYLTDIVVIAKHPKVIG